MISANVSTLDSPTGAALNLYRWGPERPRGVVIVFHGLAEHAGRYGALAARLAGEDLAVFAHDHRGHGSTSAADAPLRRFARRDGASKVVRDCRAVFDHARETVPGRPIFVFGHSMGGLIALNYVQHHGKDVAGAAIWNADFRTGWQFSASRYALKAEKALKGSDVASLLFRRLLFDAWAKTVPERRTEFDWLSHDPASVDAYIADPLCGFTPTVSMAEDIVALVEAGSSKEGLARLPPHLPIHLLGGTEDPATGNGEAMRWLADRLGDRGCSDVTLTIAEGARHETLNEIAAIRDAAIDTLLGWLKARMPDEVAKRT
ncbi:alpha/beta fold hydrolase [Fulvimarina endophytica]|uniref:Alpha/beta fold hydrolase n=1 Tax=Fulvimarina endophytica TaxID=2293836 RepID=A0A371X1F6_9HYPH|nr:alpha/beta hydrolase [Fulvimarina endophytica]RFC63051.1 alpha/beta fold hydrolase [Fulvimarina endophytica]